MVASLELERLRVDIVANPRAHLKPGEITLLRKLVDAGAAMKARSGWVLRGTWYRVDAFRRFRAFDLVSETFFNGHALRPNWRARAVIATLDERRTRKAG